MYAQKHRSFPRTVFGWLARQLFEPLNDLARTRAMADVWNFTRGCHHCGQTTWQVGPCCCYCGGDKDTPHMARAVSGMRPCCRVCLSAQLPPLPQLPQQASTLQQSRKVGEINTYTGVHKAAQALHKRPVQVYLESSLNSGKLPAYTEPHTPQPGIPRVWTYKDEDTQPRLPRVEQIDEDEVSNG